MPPRLLYSSFPQFFLLRIDDNALTLNVSRAILTLQTDVAYSALRTKYLKTGGYVCANDDTAAANGTSRIEISQISGVFVIYGITGMIAILAALFDRYYPGRRQKKKMKNVDDRDFDDVDSHRPHGNKVSSVFECNDVIVHGAWIQME